MFHPKIEAILESQRMRVARARTEPLHEFDLERRDFAKALRKKPFALIAEIKPSSPSGGQLRAVEDVGALAAEMERAGASALSVLTEASEFGGAPANLAQVKKACGLPVLAKDFVVDEFQIREAAAYGADAILLIAFVVGQRLEEFMRLAEVRGLACVVECFSKEEIAQAAAAGAEIIGVNNRSFSDFSIDLARTEELADCVPRDCLFVSESGISSREDVERLLPYGVDAFLVGTSIMKSKHAGAKVRELVGEEND